MKKMNLYSVRTFANKILNVRNMGQLCQVLNMNMYQLKLYSLNKQYKSYLQQERQDKFRLIEFPTTPLMKLQHKLNQYLQAAYYLFQTPSAYGFVMSVKGEKKPKNILENAKKHLGNPYMLKVDMKDFFHQISKQKVFEIFNEKPFRYNRSTALILSEIVTYKERLPMGAPTSPVLSNFATVKLDNLMLDWASKQQITYTRFADDLTFSNKSFSFTNYHLSQIIDICHQNNLYLNESKTTFYTDKDEKEVTGLLLHETIDIEKSFYYDLDKDIKRLKYIIEAAIIIKHNDDEIINKYKQEIRGKINFIGMIEGYQSAQYIQYLQRFEEALQPVDEQLFNRWTHFNYL